MGNILVAYLRLRSEYALVPHPAVIAARARQSSEPATAGLQSVPYVPPPAPPADTAAALAKKRELGAAVAEDADSDESDEAEADPACGTHASLSSRGSVGRAAPPLGALAPHSGQPQGGKEPGHGMGPAGAAVTEAPESASHTVPLDRGFRSFLFTIPGYDADGRRMGRARPSVSPHTRPRAADAPAAERRPRASHGCVGSSGSDQVHAEAAVASAPRSTSATHPTATAANTSTQEDTSAPEGERRSMASSRATASGAAETWGLLPCRSTRPEHGRAPYADTLKKRVRARAHDVCDVQKEGASAGGAVHPPTPPPREGEAEKRGAEAGGEGRRPVAVSQRSHHASAATTLSSVPSSSSALSALSDMGPLDCADAFLYFHPDEGTHRGHESCIYRAPETASLTLEELRERYQCGATTEKVGALARAATTVLSGGGCGTHRGACEHALHLSANVDRKDSAAAPEDASTRSRQADGAPSFVSLVEELQRRCATCTLPAVAWRRVERAAAPTATTLSAAHAHRVSHVRSGGSPLHGEAQRQLQHQPKRTPAASPSTRLSSLFPDCNCSSSDGSDDVEEGQPHHVHEDARGGPTTATSRAVPAGAKSTFYLGPQQHMTHQVFWAKVSAFGWGLRSLGLTPGGTVGLCADTRWEWLATVYACWTQGLVPVVFHRSERCLAALAAECTEMKVVVCDSSLVGGVRRHFRRAIAHARAVEAQEQQGHHSHRSPSLEARRSGRHPGGGSGLHGAPGMAATRKRDDVSPPVSPPLSPQPPTSEGGSAQRRERMKKSLRQRRRQRRPRAVPLFVAMRDLVSGDSQQQQVPWRAASTRAPPQEGHAEAAEEEEVDEEPLWWTDVLEHGEGKMYEHRTEQLRAWKARRRRQQLARQQPPPDASTSQPPSAARAGGAGSGTSVGGATSTQLTGTHLSSSSGGLAGDAAVATCLRLHHEAPLPTDTAAARAHAPISSNGNNSSGGGGRLQSRREQPVGSLPAALPRLVHRGDDECLFSFPSAAAAPFSLRTTDLAMIVYAEGEPRGVMLTHGALKASINAYTEKLREFGLLSSNSSSVSGASAVGEEAAAEEAGRNGATALRTGGLSVTRDDTPWRIEGRRRLQPAHGAASTALSSGSPTGPHGLVASLTQRGTRRPSQHRRTYVAYRPQHDVLELVLETALLLQDYLLCFGSRQTLFDTHAKPHGDLTEYKPQFLTGCPELYAHVCRRVEGTLPVGGYRRLIFDVGYEERRLALRRGLDTPYLNDVVFSQPRQLLGGRCRLALSYGGPLHPRVQEYLQIITGAAVAQVYAPTEAAGCGLMEGSWAGEQHVDSLGGPLGAVEVKLRDVADPRRGSGRNGSTLARGPDSGWSHRGVRSGGELLLRGPTITCGFYRQVEKAAEVLEEGGWLHTGDVVERLPNGAFRLVTQLRTAAVASDSSGAHGTTAATEGRNSSGHVLALEYLEGIYGRHPICATQPLPTAGLAAGTDLPDRVHVAAPSAAARELSVCLLTHRYRPYLCALVLSDEAHAYAFLSHPQTVRFLRAIRRQRSNGAVDSTASHSMPLPNGPNVSEAEDELVHSRWQWAACLQDEGVRAAVTASLNHVACCVVGGGGLRSHEQLRDVRVLGDVWSRGNGLRSPTGKVLREAVEERYADIIAEMFAEES